MPLRRHLSLLLIALFFTVSAYAYALPEMESAPRRAVPLLDGWRTTATENTAAEKTGFEAPSYDDSDWQVVRVPHNWDGYEGFRQVKHGVFHGSAWYRNSFELAAKDQGRAIFLFFEGVGSYATVWVNGQLVGKHAGGLTTFTLDVTDAVHFDRPNTVAVRADHPAGIRDLPWVCGGCELAYGFSEGTQPFGISRPVTVLVTDELRIAPFGIHAWNDADVSTIHLSAEVANHSDVTRRFTVRSRLLDADGQEVAQVERSETLAVGKSTTVSQSFDGLQDPRLWSPAEPYLHTVVVELVEDGSVVDRTETRYGIRWIEWPDLDGPTGVPLKINGEPFFINGVADYEHLMGESHAFTDAQIDARVAQIRAAGFNAFRDAHHPHNLRFNQHWDEQGVLWWTQFGAHIWFDNPDFRANYRQLLRDWVKERRNSPSLFLWTLQNESKLPAWFASEARAIVREMDPTASEQRLVVTCNGGDGTDWDVPQNWSGTYGGDPFLYNEELIQQRLVGEYGAWRSIEFHSEGGFQRDGPLTEDRMAGLLEIKLGEAESVREQVIGHFMWPFTTHQNPGRNVGNSGQQTLDGIRALDQIGPANNKGLQTIWGEPLDAFYMYRSNYADPATDPMVYIVSHTWPDRWTEPGIKDNIRVYSNAEEVELFNGYRTRSLGVRTRGEKGSHFRWDGVPIEMNLLYAEARIGGETVAADWITLHHLPEDPGLAELDPEPENLTAPAESHRYLYRVNAGGPAYTDINGAVWEADRVYRHGDSWGSRSWAERFANLDPLFGSKREIFDPILGTADDALFQSFRYGRDELSYEFAVPDGEYRVELYFVEPWYGTGGGDATGWRLFDVAVNDQTVLEDLDLFAEAGRARAVKKTVQARAQDGRLRIHFPHVASYQAVISAIAIAAVEDTAPPASPESLITDVRSPVADLAPRTWLDTGIRLYPDADYTLSDLSWELRESDWLPLPLSARQTEGDIGRFTVTADASIYVAHDPRAAALPDWLNAWEETPFSLQTTRAPGVPYHIYRHRAEAGESVILGPNGRAPAAELGMYAVLVQRRLPPPPASGIFAFTTRGSRAPAAWQAVGNLRAGRPLYGDGGPAIAEFSSRLSDCDWIRTAQADAANDEIAVSFQVQDHTLVYVGLDRRIEEPPSWMAEGWFAADGYSLSTTDSEEDAYRMWERRFLPGETVRLGPNATLPDGSAARMYTTVVRSVRAAFTLQTEEQANAEGLVATELPAFTGEGYVDLALSPQDHFAVLFEVGVGDRYGLNFRYHSRADEDVTVSVIIRNTADGTVVCDDTYTFPPTGGGVWAILRERTCESTNAGIYAVELRGAGLKQLAFDSLQVE